MCDSSAPAACDARFYMATAPGNLNGGCVRANAGNGAAGSANGASHHIGNKVFVGHLNRSIASTFRYLFFSYFSYSTVRLAKVHSLRVAIIFRLFQLIIFSYIIGWDIVYKKGYQIVDEEASSTISTKVKGLGFVRYNRSAYSKSSKIVSNIGRFVSSNATNGSFLRVFDTADYIIPSSEYNSIFVLTNFFEQVQRQGACDEEYNKNDFTDVSCKTDNDCKNKVVTNVWNGIPTGRCIRSTWNKSATVCEINSWCPLLREDKGSKENLIQNVGNYTILIKNNIQFKLFNKKESNYVGTTTNKYISECAYFKNRDPNCPVFLISDILEKAEPDAHQRELLMMRGGIIEILITWKCDYDIFWDPCKFTYEFIRFDLRFTKTSSIASGFNFRTAHNYMVEGVTQRTLIKAYGLKFIIVVTGRAGKFNIVPLLITIGSGIGLLSIATIIADLAISTFSKEKQLYNDLIVLDTVKQEEDKTNRETST